MPSISLRRAQAGHLKTLCLSSVICRAPRSRKVYAEHGSCYIKHVLNIVCPWSWHSLLERGHTGHARGLLDDEEHHRGRFLFRSTKSIFSIFWSAEIGFFYEAATETSNQKLHTTFHINIRPSEVRISALVLTRKPSGLFSEFCTSSCRFRCNGGGFTL
jgi:hypothetical protein